jgi:hypothetical protein
MMYVKFFPKNLALRTLTYNVGKNVDPIPFDANPTCGPGGIYYTSFDEKMFNFIYYGPIIGFIKIDDGVPIVKVGNDKFKSPEINIVEFKDFKEWVFSDESILKNNEKIKLEFVTYNGCAIQFIKDPSEAVQIAAVKNNKYSIGYIKDPSEAVKLEAVRNNGDSIRWIKDPSEELKLEAVKNNGDAIQWIKDPSKAVKLESVIRYIKDPS